MFKRIKGVRPDSGAIGGRSHFTLLPLRPTQVLGGVPSAGCRAASRGRAGDRKKSLHSQRGVTLIESALVISIIALLVLASLLALNALMEQRRLTQTVSDIVAIRSAVTKWCAGGPILVVDYSTGQPVPDESRTLRNFAQLAGFLPDPLETLAQKNMTLTLLHATPWDGAYHILTPEFDREQARDGTLILHRDVRPRIWTLTVTDIPGDLLEPLANQLRNTGAYFVSTIPPISELPASDSADPRALGIVFRE